VQFIDGDCELQPVWLDMAAAYMDDHQDVAMVCGRLRERFPERSVYNQLCDMEWNTPVGETKACGGIAMARASVFKQVQGFRKDMIAGEEPELCVRLRQVGWKIWRLDAEMALHDAAMLRFTLWWKRALRAGYAFAEGACLHGRSPERHYVRESVSAWTWGLGIPVATLLFTLWMGWAGLLLLTAYPLQVIRLGLRGQYSARANWWRAFFLVLGKFPEIIGQLKFLHRVLTGNRQRLIEYK
jgi:GT2 family glycosyltransferase